MCLSSRILAAALISAGAFAFTHTAGAQEHTFRLHSFGSPTSLDHTAHLDRWAEAVEADSDGRIAIEVYPAMQLGGRASDLVQQMEDGVVDIIWTLPGFTPGRFPGAQGLELPFMNTGTSETMSPAAMEFIENHLQKEFEGIKVISVHATDGSLIHTIDEPIKTLEDFEGKRLRVAGRFIGEAVKGLGATPVGIAFPEVYEALSRNQVDGMLINWAITQPMRFYEVTSYHTDSPLYQSMLMTLMRQDAYDSLPDDLKAVIDKHSGIEYATRMGEIWDTATDPARQTAIDNGNTVVTLSDEERARWKEAVTPAYTAWIETMNERGYDGEALFKALQEITAKHGRE
ncbi:MAG: TRAP transporter substrate-binding protein [Pseudomonadota bacterium]